MSPRPTHFLCLPLVNQSSRSQLTSSLARFERDRAIQQGTQGTHSAVKPTSGSAQSIPTSDSSDNEPDRQSINTSAAIQPSVGCIPKKAIRPIGTLHLTLGVMSLDSKERIDGACELLFKSSPSAILAGSDVSAGHVSGPTIASVSPNLQSLTDEPALSTGLNISLQGLNSMQRPSKTRVLYAEPKDASGRLLPFCNSLRDKFTEAGFMIDEGRELKLHATIVNTIYAPKLGKGRKAQKVEFDASEVIERWKDEIWATVNITKLAICEMGAKETKDGNVEYVEIAEVKL